MNKYNYLIIGGSMAADAAIKAIRKEDADSTIGLLCEESFPPYRRPALSKQLWHTGNLKQIWLNTEKFNIDIIQSTKAVDINPAMKIVTDKKGMEYEFDKLLIATGVSPRKLNPACGDVHYFRNLEDFNNIRKKADELNSFAIIGGGFVGLELAACLNASGKDVSMIFPEESLGCLVFPDDLSGYIHKYYQDRGVKIFAGELVEKVDETGGMFTLSLKSGKVIYVDDIIASVGCVPNIELAKEANLPVDNGILADEKLNCGHPDIYTAGDVTNFFNPILKKRMRVEHADNAVMMGRHAGLSMLGNKDPYSYLPSFYADMFDLKMKAVGEISAKLETKAEWKDPLREGVIYYLCNGNINGVLYWNTPAQYDEARSIITDSCNE